MRIGIDPEVGVLTVAAAKEMGLFSASSSRVKVSIPQAVWIDLSDGMSLIIHSARDAELADKFPPSDNRVWVANQVDYGVAKLKFGDRHYFICPFDQRRCTKLFIYKEIVASKRAFKTALKERGYRVLGTSVTELKSRVVGLDKPRRWSAKKRNGLLSELQNVEGISEDLDRRLGMERRRLNREKVADHWESMSRSTTKGLDEGQGLGYFNVYQKFLEQPLDWIADPQPSRIFRAPASPDLLTNFRELDIRVLIDRDRLNVSRLSSSRLWSLPIDPNEEWIILHVTPSESAIPTVIIEYWLADKFSEFQKLEMATDPGSDRPRRFICPVTRMPVDILYLRNGMFASRHAHRLKFPPGGKKRFVLNSLQSSAE